jgi:hypothetical protein
MLAQLKKMLNVALVWPVESVGLVHATVNSGDLTNHLEDPRSILATLVCGHGAHNYFSPNEVKHTKGLLIETDPHKQIFSDLRDVVVVAYLRRHSVPEKLVQHPIDRLHPMGGAKLNVAISTIIHKSHLTIKRDFSTMDLLTTKIL